MVLSEESPQPHSYLKYTMKFWNQSQVGMKLMSYTWTFQRHLTKCHIIFFCESMKLWESGDLYKLGSKATSLIGSKEYYFKGFIPNGFQEFHKVPYSAPYYFLCTVTTSQPTLKEIPHLRYFRTIQSFIDLFFPTSSNLLQHDLCNITK